jgi:preprotein translocase subunit YajC
VSLAASQGGGAGSLMPLLLIVLLFGVMYVMMIRPQQKRRREAERMQSALAAGDRAITIGGLHVTIVSVDDDTATVEIAPGVNVKFARPAIAKVIQQEESAVDDDVVQESVVDPAESPITENPVVETRKSKD